MVQINADDKRILLGDGVNIRYHAPDEPLPPKHQLHIAFEDGSCLVCTVQMYGGLWAFTEGSNDNPYYVVAKQKPSPLSDQFDAAYFLSIVANAKNTLSAKALLATEQRIPGLGNGVLQDILFNARIHPKTKLSALGDDDLNRLFQHQTNAQADDGSGRTRHRKGFVRTIWRLSYDVIQNKLCVPVPGLRRGHRAAGIYGRQRLFLPRLPE